MMEDTSNKASHKATNNEEVKAGDSNEVVETDEEGTSSLTGKRKTSESPETKVDAKKRKNDSDSLDQDLEGGAANECNATRSTDGTEADLQSDAPTASLTTSTSPATSTNNNDEARRTSSEETKKPAAQDADADDLPKAGSEAGDSPEDNDQSNAPAAGDTARPAAAARQEDPEGIRIVKEIVAQRKATETDDTDPILMDGWFNWLDDLLGYYHKHGHCQVRDAENHILYSWLKRQRIMYRKGKLEPEKLRILQLLKTNGFEMPTGGGDRTARAFRGRGQSGTAGSRRQAAASGKQSPTSGRQPAAAGRQTSGGQGPIPRALQANQAAVRGGENPTQPQLLQGANLAAALLSGAAQSQPGIRRFPAVLSTLQASSAAGQLMATPAYATALRPPRQDPPARVAGAAQEDPSASREAQRDPAAALLSSLPPEALVSTLGALAATDPALALQLQNLLQPNNDPSANMQHQRTAATSLLFQNLLQPHNDPSGNMEAQRAAVNSLMASIPAENLVSTLGSLGAVGPRLTGSTDSAQAIVLLLEQQQEQQRQQQQRQQQLLLEQLIRDRLRRQQDDERP